MNRIGVTGASGYLGSVLCEDLERAGFAPVRFTRSGDGGRAFDLRREVDPADLRDLDGLVHGAWDLGATTWAEAEAINVRGSVRLLHAARSAGVARTIFISSLSAFRGCASTYGLAKLAVEQEAFATGAAVVRPGLIHGRKPLGLYATLSVIAGKLPVVPLIGGNQPLYPAHIDDVSRLIMAVLRGEVDAAPPAILACQETSMSFRDILATAAEHAGKKPAFVPVPLGLAMFGLRAAETARIPLRFRSDSLRSLMQLPAEGHAGDARRVELPFTALGDVPDSA